MNKDIPELQNKRQIKPYLVMQYLIKNSDENNLITSHDIVAYLEYHLGTYIFWHYFKYTKTNIKKQSHHFE